MSRFFVSPEELKGETLMLTGENAAHARVLRIKCGEQVILCDGQGRECSCIVTDINPDQITLSVSEHRETCSEPGVFVAIYMAFSKGDKFEHVIQKATELGAGEIVAFPSARCISKPDEKSITKKLERWQKIASSAAEQSGRGRIPKVVVLNSYDEALKRAACSDLAILFYENEQGRTLHDALSQKSYSSVSLLTGPEGGLESAEVKKAVDAGLKVCTLGKRILRCETAPLCALSAVMYDSGEF